MIKRPRVPQHNLGAIYTKVCVWCDQEFKTSQRTTAYCSTLHRRNAQKARYRERKYAARESLVSSKPGASYRLTIHAEERKATKLAELVPMIQKTPVVMSGKAPMKVMRDFINSPEYNLPEYDDGLCVHQVSGYCVLCDFR